MELSIGLVAPAVFLVSFKFLTCGLTPKYFESAVVVVVVVVVVVAVVVEVLVVVVVVVVVV